MKSSQNLLGITFVILKIQRCSQSIRTHDRGVIRKRQFHQGHETHEATLPRGHFLAHHAGVSVAEKKNQPSARNAIGAKISCLLNYSRLGALQFLQSVHRTFEEREASTVWIADRTLVIHEVLSFTLRRVAPGFETLPPNGLLGCHTVGIIHNDREQAQAKRSFG